MQNNLAPYAVTETNSRGRKFPQEPHKYRSDFERDRDRIIHSQAFRRLEGKTQVFTPGLDDNYRNRLTHSIEVAQIGRTIAKILNVNETLTEAICLAHDLGHPPFGHRGEKILDRLMHDFGGFEHNKQTLRIVDFLERPYSAFSGLNLMYETRLGLAKHRSPYDVSGQTDFTQLSCCIEGQIADISDRIAYNCHDLEDGLRSGLLNDKDLEKITIVLEAKNKINADAIEDKNTLRTRIAKSIIDILVSCCIETSLQKIKNQNLKKIEDIYNRKDYIVSISDNYEAKLIELEKFLHKNMYCNTKLADSLKKVDTRLERLFQKFCKKRILMPPSYQKLISVQGIERTVCDYIAGMTDRFCLKMVDND